MSTAVEASVSDVYVAPIRVDEIFADQTYQRILDVIRARKIAATWDRRLAGILEVSDRGEDADPRYAIIDGQHRWAAASYLSPAPLLVANVHEGLTVADEAALFDKLNRLRKQPTTWDHWKARRAAGDELILAMEKVAADNGLLVAERTTTDGILYCIGTIEKIAKTANGIDLLDSTLKILVGTWGKACDAFEAPLVGGVALFLLAAGSDLDAERLIDSLINQPPRRVRYSAESLRDTTPGSLMKLTALTVARLYNAKPGPKFRWPPRWSGSLPKAVSRGASAELALDIDEQAVEFACQGTPMHLNSAEREEVVRRLTGRQPNTEIARRIHTTPQTVYDIRHRMGLATEESA